MGTIALPQHGPIYVDTCALVYHVERCEPYFTASRPLWEAVETETIEVVTSGLTLMETLVKPLQIKDRALAAIYRDMILRTAAIRCLPVSVPVLELAAGLRAEHGLKTPDAIHAASALFAGCALFVTNDAGFRRVAKLNIAILSEVAAS